jgi:hypothetical protein
MNMFRTRAENGLMCSTLAAEAWELWQWTQDTYPQEKGLPGSARVVENQIRGKYNELKQRAISANDTQAPH